MKSQTTSIFVAVALLTSTLQTTCGDESSVVPSAISMIFSPQHEPKQRTMGLYQRSFVDLVDEARDKLQVALVIDGTSSMGGDLDKLKLSLRQMVDDLKLYKGKDASFQIVIYRDTGVAPRHIELPVNVTDNAFTADREILAAAIDKLEALSGAPYFHELVDLGIQTALTKLPWDENETTTRWIVVFGDAPPYDEGFNEDSTKAARQVGTQQLSAAAQTAEIKINFVLCTSRAQEQEASNKVRRKTQNFMATLANDTGGKMLDLTYDNIRRAIEEAAAQPRLDYERIGTITRQDTINERARAEEERKPYAQNRRIRLAVLPHLPISEMSFDPQLPEVKIAADLRRQLREVKGFDVKSSTAVERQLKYLRKRFGIEDTRALIQSLAGSLNVDYIVWGTLQSKQGVTQVSSAFYGQRTGTRLTQPIVIRMGQPEPGAKDTLRLASSLIEKTGDYEGNQRIDLQLRQNLVAFRQENMARLTPISTADTKPNALLAGFTKLEKGLELGTDDPESTALLEAAEADLREAIQGPDGDGAFANYLLASCYFNQAQQLASAGFAEEAKAKSTSYRGALNRARSARDFPSDELKREINGDYQLLIAKDVEKAITEYQTLIKSRNTPLHAAARAHWMLAGIYAGDWNVDKKYVDPQKARDHVIQILSHWEDSPYGQYYRRALNWDDAKGTQLPHLPKVNQPLAEAIDS